jgi:hypothetical protein
MLRLRFSPGLILEVLPSLRSGNHWSKHGMCTANSIDEDIE